MTNSIAKLPTIAKMVALKYPDVYREVCQAAEPMLRNISLVPRIGERINEIYPELDKIDQSILFAAAIYHAYSPATMQGAGLERLPNGIRSQVCELMGWKDAPTLNYYHRVACAYFKGPTFRAKVDIVLSAFQGYSVKPQQTQLF